MNYDQRYITPVAADCYPSLLGFTMFLIGYREHKWIVEYFSRTLERYFMLPQIVLYMSQDNITLPRRIQSSPPA